MGEITLPKRETVIKELAAGPFFYYDETKDSTAP
jgi:hypothetical protein